jgi:hypothetical protein
MVAIVVSAAGVTVNYHYCSTKNETYVNAFSKIECEHVGCLTHQTENSCCSNTQEEEKSDKKLEQAECCIDFSENHELSYETTINSVKFKIQSWVSEIKTRIDEAKSNLALKTHNYIKDNYPVFYTVTVRIVQFIHFVSNLTSEEPPTSY